MSLVKVQRRRPGSRADAHHPTRLELIDAAMAVAERDGLHALSVEAVTRAAGHAKGTFYVHFDDRTELLVSLHERFHDELFARIRAMAADLPAGSDRARAQIVAFLDGCRRQEGVRAILVQARAVPQVAELVRRRNDEAAAALAADLVGVTDAPLETARLLVVATIEAASRELEALRRLPRMRAALLGMVPD